MQPKCGPSDKLRAPYHILHQDVFGVCKTDSKLAHSSQSLGVCQDLLKNTSAHVWRYQNVLVGRGGSEYLTGVVCMCSLCEFFTDVDIRNIQDVLLDRYSTRTSSRSGSNSPDSKRWRRYARCKARCSLATHAS